MGEERQLIYPGQPTETGNDKAITAAQFTSIARLLSMGRGLIIICLSSHDGRHDTARRCCVQNVDGWRGAFIAVKFKTLNTHMISTNAGCPAITSAVGLMAEKKNISRVHDYYYHHHH